MIDRIARRIAELFLRRITTGQLVIVEDGDQRTYGSGPPAAIVHVRSPRVWRKLLRGSRGFAESYFEGLWDSPDVTAVVRVAARNVAGIDRLRRRLAPLRAPVQRVTALARAQTRRRARRSIAAHYDLGNRLFELMLDPTMMYSAALFDRPGMTLEQASVAKLDRICDRLDLGPDDHVVEIGTGWGGFAVHAAATRGCRVTTTTISREQRDWAVESVRREGLEQLVTVLLDDYRDLTGSYDKLVSIEMIEAVGWRDFGTFFAKCSDLLAPDGLMLLQAITIDDRAYEVEKAGSSFINTYVFPDGCLPSMEIISRCVSRDTDMQALALEDLTPHYAETIRRWRDNFHANLARAEALGYDERFQRLWTLYLSWCEAGFAERRIGDVQLLLAKPRHRSAPWADVHSVAADPERAALAYTSR
jgi:cyclopropane-fatty-acyl-phospholipid synthase